MAPDNQSAGIVPLFNSLPVNMGGTNNVLGFPGGSVVKNLLANAEDMCLILGSGRSSGEGNSNPLQYTCLENLMDTGAWLQTMGSQRVGDDLETTQHKNNMLN